MSKKINLPKRARPRRRTFIRQWREFRNLTQEELAERISSSAASVSRIEKGVQPYTQDSLEVIAEALQTDPASLLTRDPSASDGIWTVWDRAKEADRQKIVDIANTIVGKPK